MIRLNRDDKDKMGQPEGRDIEGPATSMGKRNRDDRKGRKMERR